MRVAIVHDWLVGMRGGERCLEVLCGMFPQAELFTAFYEPSRISSTITSRVVHVSSLNRLPGIRRYYRYLLPLYPLAAASLRRSLANRAKSAGTFDLLISVSHCLAKNIGAAGRNGIPSSGYHLCYCLTPMRYIWDQYDSYFGGKRLEPLYGAVAARLRYWDIERSNDVDQFCAISEFVRQRIERYYGREADVIFPPVRTDWLKTRQAPDEGADFLCVNALVPYKNTDVVVQAFSGLPHRLTVVGSGPEKRKLQKISTSNVRFIEQITDAELSELYSSSKALLFAAEEDFGMTPVEAQAAGRPVICYARGGVLETVDSTAGTATGIYFNELTPSAVQGAVVEFLRRQHELTVDNCVTKAAQFSVERFEERFAELLEPQGFSIERSCRPEVVQRSVRHA